MKKIISKERKRNQRRRGQSMVEFAIVLPVFLLVFFGIIDFSLFTYDYVALRNAARAGAQFAITNPTSYSTTDPPVANTIQYIIEENGKPNSLNLSDIQIQYYAIVDGGSALECGYYDSSTGTFNSDNGYTENNCLTQGNTIIRITLTTTYNFVTPVLQSIVGNGVTMTTSSALIEEQT